MAEATETLPRGSCSPLTAPPSVVTLKQPVNIDIQLDHNPSVEPEMSLTGRPTDDGERRVVTPTQLSINQSISRGLDQSNKCYCETTIQLSSQEDCLREAKFSCQWTSCLHSLPAELRSPDISLDVFKARLKNFLFNC